MDFESYLTRDRSIPFEDAASFSVALKGKNKQSSYPAHMTKEARMGALKVLLAKHAEGENAKDLQAAVMTDPQVQMALDYQQAQAQAQHSTAQLLAMQEQNQQMQQGMQMLQQQGEQLGQQLQQSEQEKSQLQEQLQGEMQMRQQANMQAMSAQDQAINTKAMAQKQRMDLTQMADQLSLQLKQVAAQDPEQAQMQQQQAQMQQQEAEQQAQLASMPPKQRKEIEEAQKAQQHAQVQEQQAEEAQTQAQVQQQGPMAQAMQQQAAAQQPQQESGAEGGMVAQSSAGMSKVDLLRYKMQKAAEGTCSVTGKPMRGPGKGPGMGRPHGTGPGLGLGPGKGKGRATLSRKEKKSEIEKYTGDGEKVAMVPPPTSAYKTILIEAGMGAGLGAITGATYEAARQRFSHAPPTSPSSEELALDQKNRAAQIKAKESPTIINRMAATKTLAQLDAERSLRENPKKAVVRRALQGAIIGGHAAPLLMAAKRNLSPKIAG